MKSAFAKAAVVAGPAHGAGFTTTTPAPMISALFASISNEATAAAGTGAGSDMSAAAAAAPIMAKVRALAVRVGGWDQKFPQAASCSRTGRLAIWLRG